jgi:glycosyltransferase involved in cell wall biosynthesis
MTRAVSEAPSPTAAAPADRRVCVVIPTYNNNATVGDVVRRVAAMGLPLLVVDDGSTDGTGDAARSAGAEVIAHPHNMGKGCALITGWRAAAERGYSHAVTVDADAQHPPEEIPVLLAVMQREPDALVVGCRDMSSDNVPRSSRIGRAASDFMLWAAASHELKGERPDSQCGFRVYPLRHVLALGMTGRRYEFEMEILVRAAWHGIPLRARPVNVYYPAPEERVSHFHKWKDNGRIIGIYTRLMLIRLFWPLTRPRRRLLPR